MARLTFRRPPSAALRTVTASAARSNGAAGRDSRVADESQATVGPGWFDSTFELWQGLEVREELPAVAWRTAALFGRGFTPAGSACAA